MRRRLLRILALAALVAMPSDAALAESFRPHGVRQRQSGVHAAQSILKAVGGKELQSRKRRPRAGRRQQAGAHLLSNAIRASARRGAAKASRTFSPSRHVYCLGNDEYGPDGWKWDGTSTGWIRQYPYQLPTRVSFEPSLSLMQSLGCETVKAEVRPRDLDPNGGTTHQRAQLYVTDDQLAKNGRQPPLGDTRGQTSWYGFAFATNPGYTPQTGLPSGAWANWNLIFSWHDTPLAGVWAQANIQLVVATTGPASGSAAVSCGARYSRLAQPRLSVEINGGNQDDPGWYVDDADNTCRRYFGPAFVPGRTYHVTMEVTWGDHRKGAVRLWIGDDRVVDEDRIDDMWYGAAGQASVYPVFENYRPYSPGLAVPNVVYYGGLVKGATAGDVETP
jgi:hypothetical protein